MKREERQQQILKIAAIEGAVDLEQLARHFDVSRMTIHRDLDELDSAGLLRKIRGGATLEAGTRFESDFRFRAMQGKAAKQAIAKQALNYVEPGMTVIVNDGSTAAVLGSLLAQQHASQALTVITNNAAVMEELQEHGNITLMALGGLYSAKFNAYFGKITEDSLSRIHADLAFISSPAVFGTKVFHMDETVLATKRAMIKSSKKRCLLVHHNRFGQTALHKLADLDEFDHIVTDSLPIDSARSVIEEAGIALTIANTEDDQNVH